MDDAAGVIIFLFGLLVMIALGVWAVRDANRRNKPALLVLLAVVCFFPFGLIAWLLFRPPAAPDQLARPT
jgi:type IV secretory pathway TrbL component